MAIRHSFSKVPASAGYFCLIKKAIKTIFFFIVVLPFDSQLQTYFSTTATDHIWINAEKQNNQLSF